MHRQKGIVIGKSYAQHTSRIVLIVPEAANARMAAVAVRRVPQLAGIESLIDHPHRLARATGQRRHGVAWALVAARAPAQAGRRQPRKAVPVTAAPFDRKAELTESAGSAPEVFFVGVGPHGAIPVAPSSS